MTEPKWPTVPSTLPGGMLTLGDYFQLGIDAAKVAFAEWRDNLLTEIQKPGPSGVQPAPVCPIEDVVMNLEHRIEKLERRLKKVRRLAQEASDIAWAVDDATRPLTAPLSPEIRGMIKEATVPVSHTRLADEIRGAATKAPVTFTINLDGRSMTNNVTGEQTTVADGPAFLPESVKQVHGLVFRGERTSYPPRPIDPRPVNYIPVHDDDPDADELPTDTRCRAIAARFGAVYSCQLTRGHDGDHDGTSDKLRHQWASP